MVTFNNKKIELYDLDSIKSIIRKLAASENTLPDFIYFPEGTPEDINLLYDSDVNINYENLLNIFKENKTLEDVYSYMLGKNDFDIEKIVYYYILFNPNLDKLADIDLENGGDYGWFEIEKLKKILEKIAPDYRPYLEKKWEDKKSNKIKDVFQINVEKNKINVKKEEKKFEEFQNIIGINYTKFELENVKYEIELDINNLSLLEIFNNIKLNKNIPFATTHYFYKILKDFTPFRGWTNLFDRSKTYFDKYKNIDRKKNIIFKVLETNEISSMEDDFTEVILNVKENIFVKLEHNINKFNISREELTNKMLSILNITEIKNEKDIGVKGIFYFPQQTMNKYVMLDLIMNNPLFSNILAVDETTMTVKSNIFIHFTNPRVSNLTAYITSQKVKKKNVNMKKNIKNYDELFPLNSEYIRVKVSKCESIDQIKYFQKILSKLFVEYNEKSAEIIGIYQENGIDLENEEFEEEEVEDKRLKNIDPDVFQSKFTRYCPHPPTYIEDDKVSEIEKQGKKIITFPLEQVGDSIPKKYYCDYTKHIYPGLRYNPYKNSNVLPYIPCCYSRDQEKTKGSKFRNYYFGEDILEKEKKQQGIYVSNIIIPNDNFGTLPPNINKIFSIVDINGVYYRKGVYRNKNSFLNCVMQALNINDIHSISTETKINNLLSKVRKRFLKDDYDTCCKQEMYDYTLDEIRNKIENEDEYFDPKLFIRLLEIKYECNIFLFSRNNKGELILPRHIKGYYKLKNKDKCIFIYEHMGGEADRAEYPQCELIVRKEIDEEETKDFFEYNNIISRNIFNIFDKINDSYIFNKKIKFIDFDIFSNMNIIPISQSIDTYGKTRLINLIYNNNIDVSILTTPIQPFKLKIEDITNINKVNFKNALKIIKELNIKITGQIVDENNYIKEINGILGNINISIPIEYGTSPIKDIIINKNLNYPEQNFSVMEQYNKFKKLSRYITEYLFWLYSTYINNENINEVDILSPKILNDFKDRYIEIIPDFNYENIPKSFNTNSGLIKNGKLIIKSEETLKRLFYVLKLYILRNYKNIMSYYQRNMIENFYVDISDFDSFPFQVLLEGEDSVSKWIRERKKKNIIHNDIFYNTVNPYFFRNKLIGNRIYIAQNTDSFSKALNISVTWNKEKYNPGSNVVEKEKDLKAVLYSYTNNKNIKKYDIDGIENNYDIKIVGYKIKGESRFTSLLYV